MHYVAMETGEKGNDRAKERSEKQGECYQRADCDLWLERAEVARKAEELVGARRSTTLARR